MNPGDRREAIIDIAARNFARQGFHGVSMRDIAKANGSSVATLYNHFTSKDTLLLAVGERYFDTFLPHLEEARGAPQDGLTRLIAMVQATFSAGCAHRYEFLTISHDRRHVGMTPELRPLVVARNKCMQAWHRVLNEGMADGSIRPGLDPATIIWIVFFSVTGLLDDNLFEESAGSVLQDPLEALCSMLSHGLAPTWPPAQAEGGHP